MIPKSGNRFSEKIMRKQKSAAKSAGDMNMSIYTVHAPPQVDDTAPDAERFVFIRDGFYFWAFVLAPLWMLRRRLWLVLLIYVLGASVFEVVLWLMGATAQMHMAVGVLIAILIGLEAATLRRWTLHRKGWTELGIVAGANSETAERRFFDTWVTQADKPTLPATPPPASPPIRMPLAVSDIIGLFPEPQSRQ
jgi:hypothetical protein